MVINRASGRGPTGEYPRQVMATSLSGPVPPYGENKKYKFVINSISGRFIAPSAPTKFDEAEVIFVDGVAGKFHLVGYQPINNGAIGRATSQKGPYGVF